MPSIRANKPKTSAELRSFGLTMALILGGISVYTLYFNNNSGAIWVCLTFLFGSSGILAPTILRPIEKAWIRLGEIMGMVVTPIVMGVLFYGIITPMGLLMRALGRDLLDQKIDRNAKSYWKKTEPISNRERYFTPF